ncbi:MAG: RluA family pseudouridine synthase [Alphaproteobacteria bacterium]|nr:RluA family pseudouridine synthase [Alphaproteobacteria bacterium]
MNTPPPTDEHVLPPDTVVERFDRYLALHLEGFPSRAWARKAIKRGEILLNGEPAEPSRFLHPGDTLTLLGSRRPPPKIFTCRLDVRYEDDWLAVVDKPAGLVVMANRHRTLEHALPHNLKPSGRPDALRRPRPVHRLDVPTSGLLLVAKTAAAQVHLGKQFEHRQVFKRYGALVVGRPDPAEGTLDAPVGERPALSRYRVAQAGRCLKSEWVSLVDLWPLTGRTHQLRIHMANAGWPVLGDDLYGTPPLVLRGKGLYLCALELAFTHPEDDRPVRVTREVPHKFHSFLDREARRWERYHPTEGP